jgi:hypothetical protein
MPDRADQLRRRAAECLILARKAKDPSMRMALVTVASKLHDMADRGPERMEGMDRVIRALNDARVSR